MDISGTKMSIQKESAQVSHLEEEVSKEELNQLASESSMQQDKFFKMPSLPKN